MILRLGLMVLVTFAAAVIAYAMATGRAGTPW
jgi:hypothetical protein